MFKVLTEGCEPTRGTKYAACVDLYASEDVVIGAGETKMIGLGVCIDENKLKEISYKNAQIEDELYPHLCCNVGHEYFMRDHYLQLMLRSSLGKKGLILPNGVGIIDLDYRDEIKMIIHNPIFDVEFNEEENRNFNYSVSRSDGFISIDGYHIKKGDKIAQITLLEHKSYLFSIDTEVDREGGFGSTGK